LPYAWERTKPDWNRRSPPTEKLGSFLAAANSDGAVAAIVPQVRLLFDTEYAAAMASAAYFHAFCRALPASQPLAVWLNLEPVIASRCLARLASLEAFLEGWLRAVSLARRLWPGSYIAGADPRRRASGRKSGTIPNMLQIPAARREISRTLRRFIPTSCCPTPAQPQFCRTWSFGSSTPPCSADLPATSGLSAPACPGSRAHIEAQQLDPLRRNRSSGCLLSLRIWSVQHPCGSRA